mgnify:CR=1 FL=1
MKQGDLLLNEDNGYYCIFMGYEQGRGIRVMYTDGTIYVGCELPFKQI